MSFFQKNQNVVTSGIPSSTQIQKIYSNTNVGKIFIHDLLKKSLFFIEKWESKMLKIDF